MKRILLAICLLLVPSVAFAQCNGVFPNNTACGNTSGSPDTPGPVAISTFGTVMSVGVTTIANGTNGLYLYDNNGVLGEQALPTYPPVVKTANYTIATGDCFKGIQLGTGASGQFTLTLPSTSGFPTWCDITITNFDTVRGKKLSGFPTGVNPILYPKQSITVSVISGNWVVTSSPGRWLLTSNVSMYVDASLGSDSNDCLATGAGGCASVSAAVTAIYNSIDLAGSFSVTVNVPGAVSMDASHVVAVAGPFVGATGANAAAAVIIDMNNTGVLTTTTTSAAISATFGGNIQVQNGTITIGSGGTGIIAHFGGQMTILNMKFGVTVAATAAVGIFVSDNSFLYATGTNVTFTGGIYSGPLVMTLNNSTAIFEASTVAVTGNLTDQYFVFAQGNSVQQWSTGTTITLSGGVTVTGTRYQIADGGSLQTGSGVGSQTFFPGTVAGITRGYGRYDTNEPNIPMAFASFGTCNAATEGQTASATDSNTATWGAIVAAGGGNHILAYCNGTNWTVAGK